MHRLALIGNPNCGKTTLFNALTGANQKVGNWPGVTVEKKFGNFNLADQTIELVDLPGIYSLEQASQSIDEQIAQNYLLQNEVDLIINIIDGTNLERSLVLTQQLLETGRPVIVVLNMLDVAEQQGISINVRILAEKLKVPVIPIIASRKKGLRELYEQLESTLDSVQPVAPNYNSAPVEVDEDQILNRFCLFFLVN